MVWTQVWTVGVQLYCAPLNWRYPPWLPGETDGFPIAERPSPTTRNFTFARITSPNERITLVRLESGAVRAISRRAGATLLRSARSSATAARDARGRSRLRYR